MFKRFCVHRFELTFHSKLFIPFGKPLMYFEIVPKVYDILMKFLVLPLHFGWQGKTIYLASLKRCLTNKM